jgi:hypothetical protein
MNTQVDLFRIITIGSAFTAYLLGVWLLEIITARLRSSTFIKSAHTIGFVPLSALLFIFVYEVVFDQMTYLTWIALGVFLAEGVELVTHHMRCPLTAYAERLGSTHGQITDFFFPKWFADHVFQVYGGLFAVSLVVVVIRLLS